MRFQQQRIARALLGRLAPRRQFHSGNVYVHHTNASEAGTNPMITLGLINAIAKSKPGVGYFRPVDCTGDLQLIKRAFHLQDEIASMRGVDRARALQLLVEDRLDDLLEHIYTAFQSYQSRYDSVVIEGMYLSDSSSVNAQIASALGAKALLVTDAKPIRESNGTEWKTELTNNTRLSSLFFEKNSVPLLGTLIHKTPTVPGLQQELSELFKKWNLPLLGALPEQLSQQSFQDIDDTSISRVKEFFNDHIDHSALERLLLSLQENPKSLSPLLFKQLILHKASQSKRTILLPEGDEPRTVQAAAFVLKNGLSNLILMGSKDKIDSVAKQYDADLSKATIVDPSDTKVIEQYANSFYEARKHKGVTLEQARDVLKRDSVTLATCMISQGHADGMVCGAVHTTADTVRPSLQIIKTTPESPIVSSVFFMCLRDKILVYGDVAINTSPSSEELAVIAISSADTAAAFGLEPRIAMLSYATGDSNAGPLVQKVADAVAIVKSKRPDLLVEGPLQYDAAVNPVVSSVKLKGKTSPVAGQANVFVFPDLNAANIACKAVQQHTGTVAIGPILQGLRKPVNDLSRGCTVKDIIATIAATAVQAKDNCVSAERVSRL